MEIETLFAEIWAEIVLATKEGGARFTGIDPESGATVFFGTMEELTAWVRS